MNLRIALLVAAVTVLLAGCGTSWPQELPVTLVLEAPVTASEPGDGCAGTGQYEYVAAGTPISVEATSRVTAHATPLPTPRYDVYGGDCWFNVVLTVPGEGTYRLVIGDLPVVIGGTEHPWTFDESLWHRGFKGITVGSDVMSPGSPAGRIVVYADA